MTVSRVEQAARNNAIWCDTMCRAHGAPGEFHEAVWLNQHSVPRFYPNLVTLSNQCHATAQLAHIQDLVASGLPGHWSVKDSCSELALDALSFRRLFEATWLWRAPSIPMPNDHDHGIHWVRLQDRTELAKWEKAWSGSAIDHSSTPEPRLFLPSLLADPDIAFVAAYQGEEIIAGTIANRTDNVIGISNLFAPPEDRVSFWVGCVATAKDSFPGLPLVGYEGGPELALAEAVGFEKLHTFRAWMYQK